MERGKGGDEGGDGRRKGETKEETGKNDNKTRNSMQSRWRTLPVRVGRGGGAGKGLLRSIVIDPGAGDSVHAVDGAN